MQSTLTVTSASTRRADIQGLRALAVILVVSFHAGLPLPGGFVGVDVFFVISGFVITAMLMREWSKSNSISFKNFYLRRFQRLTPALIVMILVVLAVSAIFQSPFGFQQMTVVTAAGAVLLVANFAIGVTTGGYFGNDAESNPLLNTWSLSVEEQFYIVFPTLLLVGWLIARRHPRFRIAPVALICALGVASLFIAIFGSQLTSAGILPEILTGFYSPLPRAWEFAVGAALAFVAARSAEINRRVAIVAASLGLLLIAISVWTISPATAFPGPMTIVPVAGTALIIWAGCRSDNPVSEFLGARPFVSLGDISYSLYLWHWPLIVFALLLFPEKTWVALVAALI
jgi:peptidoglycan/LPS O-acetylase OafA/YrhL